MASQETYETTSAGRSLTFFRPLENRKECQDCHGEDHKVRGVVRVSLGLDRLDAELAAARNREIFVAALTILGLAVALTLFLGRVVLRPIALVAAAARRIGGGDFDARVADGSRDEIGALGRAVNDMAGGLKSAHATLEARNAELAAALDSLKESMRKVALLEQVKGELSKFVPEAVTKLLEKNPDARELEKREADVSVLFLDVEGYTRLSEELPAQRLNRMIQDYFSSFLEIIRAHHGDVNETAGDGLMVIFQSEGNPAGHARNAAGTAFQLLAKVATRRWRSTSASTAARRWSARPSWTRRAAGAGRSPPPARRPISPRASPASPRAVRSWSARRRRSASRTTTCCRTRASTSSKTSRRPCASFAWCRRACI